MLTARFPGIGTTPGPKRSPRTGNRLTPDAVIVRRKAEMRAVGVSIMPELASAPGAVPMMVAFTADSSAEAIALPMAGAAIALTKPGMPVAVSVERAIRMLMQRGRGGGAAWGAAVGAPPR